MHAAQAARRSAPALEVGSRYLCGLPPFGVAVVTYLGPVPGWPRLSRIQVPYTRKTVWARTELLRPLLVAVVP